MKYLLPASIIIILFASCHRPEIQAEAPVGSVTSVDGDVIITRGVDGQILSASPNLPLYLKDTIETRNGRIKFALLDESTFAVSANSRIVLTEFFLDGHLNFRKSTVSMLAGQLRSVISRHFASAGSEVNIETPTVIAGIRGTELAVTAEEKESAVYCLDGAVEVFKPAEREKRVLVTKDMYARSIIDKPVEEPRPIPPEIRKMFLEEADYIPQGFSGRLKTFEAEYEAKKAEMKAREIEMKRKMEEKKKDIEEKMRRNKEQIRQKEEEQKSGMEKKREEMLKKMREKSEKNILP